MKSAAVKKAPISKKQPVAKKTTAKQAAVKPAASKKEKLCLVQTCKKEGVSQGYCRLHYISNWRRIRLNEKIKAERRLNAYVDKIAKKYPKDYLEKIKETLEDEHKFKEMVTELDLEIELTPRETDDEFLAKFFRAIKPGGSE